MRKALTMFGSFALATAALGVEPSFAQVSGPSSGPGAAPSASAAARADELFKAGMSDVKQQKWSEAEAKFAAAFSLNRSYDVAANLGQTQYRLGKYRDAAENIAFALRSWPVVGKREPRELAVKRLAELRKLVATVVIRVSAPGAMVLVDGREIGRAPLDGEVFVEPGARVIEARLVGYEDAKQTIEAVKGGAHEVALTLAQAAASTISTSGGTATGAANTAESGAGGAPSGSMKGTQRTPKAQGAEDGRKASSGVHPLVLGGLVTTGVAVALGITFAVASNAKASDAEDQKSALVRSNGDTACTGAGAPLSCVDLQDAIKAKDAFANASSWSFIGAGLLGAGTVIIALTSSRATPKEAPSVSAQVVPVVVSQGAGLMISGAW
jgi:tetratricopeptide (TPR) repeat protein